MSSLDAPRPCRLLVDTPGHGDWNMAVDEVLLESAVRHGGATLRFYNWSEPTVSLGYFQASRDRSSHLASLACPVVRRITGGGAILHDRELTYSFAWRPDSPAMAATQRIDFGWLYSVFHETLRELLAEHGLAARTCCDCQPAAPRTEQPFLCFQRRTNGDLLVGDAKIAGSAQRRRKNTILQQGSVMLATSPHAPELAGLDNLARRAISSEFLVASWSKRLADRLGLALQDTPLLEWERRRAGQLVREKFGCNDWTLRR